MTTEKITTGDVTVGDIIQSRTDPRVRLTVQEVVGPAFARHPNGEPGGEWTFKGITEAEDVDRRDARRQLHLDGQPDRLPRPP